MCSSDLNARYAWVTAVPAAFVATTTLYAAWLSIQDNFLGSMLKAGKTTQGYVNAGLCVAMMACCVTIVVLGVRAVFRPNEARSVAA